MTGVDGLTPAQVTVITIVVAADATVPAPFSTPTTTAAAATTTTTTAVTTPSSAADVCSPPLRRCCPRRHPALLASGAMKPDIRVRVLRRHYDGGTFHYRHTWRSQHLHRLVPVVLPALDPTLCAVVYSRTQLAAPPKHHRVAAPVAHRRHLQLHPTPASRWQRLQAAEVEVEDAEGASERPRGRVAPHELCEVHAQWWRPAGARAFVCLAVRPTDANAHARASSSNAGGHSHRGGVGRGRRRRRRRTRLVAAVVVVVVVVVVVLAVVVAAVVAGAHHRVGQVDEALQLRAVQKDCVNSGCLRHHLHAGRGEIRQRVSDGGKDAFGMHHLNKWHPQTVAGSEQQARETWWSRQRRHQQARGGATRKKLQLV